MFELLTHNNAQGQCVKCHSVDRGPNHTRVIGWGTATLADKRQRLTTFLHEPHFGLLDERGCLTCHKINNDAKYQDTYKHNDPLSYTSNFVPMTKSQCSVCHNRKAARQDRLICHNYHVNEVTSPITTTKVPGVDRTTKAPSTPSSSPEKSPPRQN